MMTSKVFRLVTVMTLVLSTGAVAATLTVTTTDNENPGAGQVSLVMALQEAQPGDTIAFNIPGEGPHYIRTPFDGYPLITQDGLTIDGYTQSGSSPNTNPLRAANNARLRIVLDSRDGGRTPMNYNTGRPGYADSESAILGIFNAHDVTIKGLCFLGLHTGNSDLDPAIYCIAFARDHTGGLDYDDNGHVSGNWFGVEPDGISVTGGSAAAVTAFRHRDVSGGTLPELPNRNLTVGVKSDSENPRAEFNVMVAQSFHLAGEQTGARVSGNFVGVLPDGMTPYDLTRESGGVFFAGASIEIGRYNDTTILIGTDGDGVNDAEEGNIFGPLTGGARVINFYSTSNRYFIVAGNSFGVAVDGVTPFEGDFQILGSRFSFATIRFGSDFDGVSDALEGNLVVNNHPFDPLLPVINPITARDGAILSVRGNRLINNFPIPVNLAAASLFLIEPDPATFYAAHLEPADPLIIQPVIAEAGAHLAGTTPIPAANFSATIIDLYEADPEGIANGKTLDLPELPNGFVQGREYIASFVDNAAADLDPAPGSFRFDISGLPINRKNVTITANYSVEPPGTHNAQVVTSPFSEPMIVDQPIQLIASITRDGDDALTITWPLDFTEVTIESKQNLEDDEWIEVQGAEIEPGQAVLTGSEFIRLRQ